MSWNLGLGMQRYIYVLLGVDKRYSTWCMKTHLSLAYDLHVYAIGQVTHESSSLFAHVFEVNTTLLDLSFISTSYLKSTAEMIQASNGWSSGLPTHRVSCSGSVHSDLESCSSYI
ncbi:unnamed protein product [Periconia digitata]|uniref:Uncharacterized protein n=1 Tax=Periconia digitata TaxID=1303443 RepID=A0A9W4XK98_9PLEO|nr:unnamed protein product [Periconia digitata]